MKKTPPLHVGRGPVPRQAPGHRTFARETSSHARVAREGPRATASGRRLPGTGPRATVSRRLRTTVGRGPVPRQASDDRTFARDRPSRYEIGTAFAPGTGPRAPKSRRLRTTVGRGPVPRQASGNRTFARDRPSRYVMFAPFFPLRRRIWRSCTTGVRLTSRCQRRQPRHNPLRL